MEYKGTILVADDEFPVRCSFSEILKQYFPEYQVREYEDGNKLIEGLNGPLEGICMVVVDQKMRNTPTGSEIISNYARKPGFGSIPFVLHYGGYPEIGENALENGARAVLKKPANVEDIVSCVESLIGEKRTA